MKLETGLIVVKETKFDKIRKYLISIFFKNEQKMIIEFEELMHINRPKNIIIPKEIGKTCKGKKKKKWKLL